MPLPGDPDAVLAASDKLRAAAAALQDGRDALAARGQAMSGWTGQAADAARATIEGHARDLQRAADAASQAAGPLGRYAEELRAAQADYGRGEQAMLDGRAALGAAGSGAAAAADAARDAAEQAMDDAATLMVNAEERAAVANEAAARAVAEAGSGLGGIAPSAPSAPTGGGTGLTVADVGNAFASLGNAALHDPGAVAAMALGAGEVFLGAGGEIGGFALDLTGGGTVAGVPLGIASAGLIATGLTTVGAGVISVAQSATGPDRIEPLQPGPSGSPAAPRPSVTDPDLDNIVNDLYRGTRSSTRTGDGTTADAVRFERSTGESVQDKFHTAKANNYVRALRRWLRRHPRASTADREVAEREYENLMDALGRTP